MPKPTTPLPRSMGAADPIPPAYRQAFLTPPEAARAMDVEVSVLYRRIYNQKVPGAHVVTGRRLIERDVLARHLRSQAAEFIRRAEAVEEVGL